MMTKLWLVEPVFVKPIWSSIFLTSSCCSLMPLLFHADLLCFSTFFLNGCCCGIKGLSEEEVRSVAACAGEEVMIRNQFSEMNAPKESSSVNKYANFSFLSRSIFVMVGLYLYGRSGYVGCLWCCQFVLNV